MTVQKIKPQQWYKCLLPWRYGSPIAECFQFAVLRYITPLDEFSPTLHLLIGSTFADDWLTEIRGSFEY